MTIADRVKAWWRRNVVDFDPHIEPSMLDRRDGVS